jgi:hypothetical protein
MSIDQSALAHIMNVLTDLYADPELAVIREYSTNALDSHIEAGESRPIEVTTPTELRPLLTIRDYGVGLDADDIRDIYSRYGASTKRASNDAVGMLGLGCKSALAFVDQFTLAGIKDGERMLVSIARDESGAGTMTVLEAGPTDEADGVEVCIPASTYTDIEAKARDFFAYWQPGTVLLNGAEPNQLEGYAVGEYIVADRVANAWNAEGRHDANPLTVVMGNVSYPPPDGYSHEAVDSLPRDKRLVVNVPIGAVHFTPSREGLQDADRTRKAIDAALEDFQSEVAAAVTEAVTQAPDRPSAARALIEARRSFGKANVPELEWEGEEIPTILSAEDLDPIVLEGGKREHAASLWASKIVSGYNGGQSHRTPAGQISLDDAGKNPWVLAYPNAKWSVTQRRKLDRYMEHHELHDEPRKATYFITDAAAVPRPEWIDGAVTAVDWQTVRDWKDPMTKAEGGTGVGSYAGTYPVYYDGYRQSERFPAAELATLSQRKVFYVEGEKWSERAYAVARILGDGAHVVCLTSTRAAKFKRTFPEARDGVPIAQAAVAGKLRQLSELERAALAVEGRVYFPRNVLSQIDPDQLDDPKLARAAAVLRIIDAGDLRVRTEDWFPLCDRPTEDETGTADIADVLKPYALLDSISAYESKLDHIVLYANAVYAAANEGGK